MLVIEGDDLTRHLMNDLFGHLGFRTLEAGETACGFAYLDSVKSDVAALVIDWDRSKGKEGLLGTLQQQYPEMPVVLTGRSEFQVRPEVRWRNVVGVIRRPYRSGDVATMMRRIMDRRTPRRPGAGPFKLLS